MTSQITTGRDEGVGSSSSGTTLVPYHDDDGMTHWRNYNTLGDGMKVDIIITHWAERTKVRLRTKFLYDPEWFHGNSLDPRRCRSILKNLYTTAYFFKEWHKSWWTECFSLRNIFETIGEIFTSSNCVSWSASSLTNFSLTAPFSNGTT